MDTRAHIKAVNLSDDIATALIRDRDDCWESVSIAVANMPYHLAEKLVIAVAGPLAHGAGDLPQSMKTAINGARFRGSARHKHIMK